MLHEFATIPGLREDVTDLILNIKELVFKLHSPGTKYARIDKEGPGIITGHDVVSDPDIEVINPDTHIAAVSYTHLDVYKRQGQGRVGFVPSAVGPTTLN